MIKMTAIKDDGGKVLFLGLSRKNLELLTARKPIKITGKDVGCDHDVYVFFGETEDAMLAELIGCGVDLLSVVYHDDDRREG